MLYTSGQMKQSVRMGNDIKMECSGFSISPKEERWVNPGPIVVETSTVLILLGFNSIDFFSFAPTGIEANNPSDDMTLPLGFSITERLKILSLEPVFCCIDSTSYSAYSVGQDL